MKRKPRPGLSATKAMFHSGTTSRRTCATKPHTRPMSPPPLDDHKAVHMLLTRLHASQQHLVGMCRGIVWYRPPHRLAHVVTTHRGE